MRKVSILFKSVQNIVFDTPPCTIDATKNGFVEVRRPIDGGGSLLLLSVPKESIVAMEEAIQEEKPVLVKPQLVMPR